jgi:hypothetical protein
LADIQRQPRKSYQSKFSHNRLRNPQSSFSLTRFWNVTTSPYRGEPKSS